MARRILDFDGTVVAAGGAYPFGDIKDNPSGTRINSKSNSDIQQFFQKLLNSAGITANSLADNTTNGYQLTEALSTVIGTYAATYVVSQLGATYDNTKVYVLTGATSRSTDGICLYDGEIYYIEGNGGPVCGGGTTDVLSFQSPMNYTNGLKSIFITCAASGSGIADYADVVYYNDWVSGTPTFAALGGGSISSTTIVYSKFKTVGKTCNYQLLLSPFTITGTVNTINVSLPFLPNNVFANNSTYFPCVYQEGSSSPMPAYALTVNGSPSILQITTGSNFVASANNNLFVNVVFEID